MANAWLELVKKTIAQVKKEGKTKGSDIIKESIRRAKIIWDKTKKGQPKK